MSWMTASIGARSSKNGSDVVADVAEILAVNLLGDRPTPSPNRSRTSVAYRCSLSVEYTPFRDISDLFSTIGTWLLMTHVNT